MCQFGFASCVNNEYFWYNDFVCEMEKRYKVFDSEMAKIWLCNNVYILEIAKI